MDELTIGRFYDMDSGKYKEEVRVNNRVIMSTQKNTVAQYALHDIVTVEGKDFIIVKTEHKSDGTGLVKGHDYEEFMKLRMHP